MFFGILFIVNDIINIPFAIYGTFVIEEKYGFNKTTWRTFFSDKLKGYGLTIVLGSIVIVPILYFFEFDTILVQNFTSFKQVSRFNLDNSRKGV